MNAAASELHLRRRGSGPPVLFLHGLLGLDDDETIITRLAAAHEVYAPDHPGFGRSGDDERLETVADLAYFYLELLEERGLRDVHVVGHSLGGWIALEMAVRDRARLRSLTLIDSAGIRVDGVPRGDMFMATPPQLGALMFRDQRLAGALAARQEDPAAQETLARNRVAAARLTWHPRLHDPGLARWLHRVRVPTLIVWGSDDALIPVPHAEALAARIPDARVHLIPGCGHMATVEQPAAVVRAFEAFAGGMA